MYRHLAAAVVALGLMAAPAAAQESVLFGHFKTMCADGEGAGPRALALARESGWAEIPASMFAGQNNPFEDLTAYMNAEDSGDLSLLMVGKMRETYEGTPVDLTVCAVMGGNFETQQPPKPDPRPIAETWLGMDAHPALVDEAQGMKGYAFRRSDGTMTALRPSEAALMQAALNGDLHIVMVNDGAFENVAMLMYMRPFF